ncbi:MAG: RNB domain-containing ribonuclease [Gammaproteobacteria bacterium]|uniref:RNB domain-containing ribonuclease n=1 Tax=Rhodoferax sp. TaxID=50421 RepID=UPI001847E4E8|nr:RNB domain-containing ribonuclease [Rhodoferax sp.]MBU3899313.1 RNB domain-containing ribonuclease [Gammaproteobacteria bacterium]MBA3057007.1 RNB domain-containing ribonuclease [Rhodoferax sp.]MBU3996885.1 RNB domain-containing ribonuclease [Gammaproteobacteria bacterium]MBU4081289.1 RNB domain-containing ribonuclease [Gammaproteobacteria bacterium]MBU4114306.1 RNB domain-containing ribonuclease [Gammaproteobacteria bacterium]
MNPINLQQIAIEAMLTRGLLPAFAPQALQEAENARQASPERSSAILDLRHLTWFSIDNDDTRDLDQLSVAQALPDGATRLLVAVADVDTKVTQGGAVDGHAAFNTTSVYTAAGVFPMLPEVLSTDLTSLHEGQERLSVVVEMQVQANGTVSMSSVYRATVLNRAKLTYDSVSAWLDGEAPPPPQLASVDGLEDQLRLHDAVAGQLRQWRQTRGALNVNTLSARPVFEDGQLVDLRPDNKNRAKDLIADLMIAANGATARYLAEKGFASLRRLLQAPRRWDRIVTLAAGHGVQLPATPDAPALDLYLSARRLADPGGFADLSLAVVKLLGSGEYAAAPAAAAGAATGTGLGHFGLAVNDYAHSTAPNRRFPDLVTQRLLKAAIAGQASPYSPEQLTEIAQHCTLQEDNASKVERQVLKAAGAWLLHGRIGEVFDALVTGAAAKGTFVRIHSPMLEGRVVRGFEGLDVGDTARVRLLAVDAERSFIDFERS